MSGLSRTTVRTARKPRPCGFIGYGCRMIEPGELYLEHVIAPNHPDVGNTRWWRSAECRECAHRCGRGDLIEDR
jgi:hypothetical protein